MTPENPSSPGNAPVCLPLQTQSDAGPRASAAQQHYSALLSRVDTLFSRLARLRAWADKHRHAHLQVLHQTEQVSEAMRQSLLFFLHEKLQNDDLTAQQQRMARNLVHRLIGQLGPTAQPQVHVLAELYRQDEDEQVLRQELVSQAQRLREEIEAALGQPIHNASQYTTPEAMMAAGMRQWQRHQQAMQARKAAKRAARKAIRKPDSQQQRETRLADARGTIRTLYRQLASVLHPDRETDDKERERKTALMSQLNAAYERNDLSTLLQLQMKTSLSRLDLASQLANEQLLAMCQLLKEQVSALENELQQLQGRLTQELCVPVSDQLSEATMTQALHSLQAQRKQVADSLSADWRSVQNEDEFKRWLKQQNRVLKSTSE